MRTDFSTLLGILLTFSLVIGAIYLGGSPKAFADLPSFLIVFGGTFAVTAAAFSFREVILVFSVLGKAIFYYVEDPKKAGTELLTLAEEARKSGVLSLQGYANQTNNRILQKGLGMIVDGLEPETAEKILKQDIQARLERHQKGVSILRKAAEIAPAMGLIGTLIGLVQMLGNLDDPAKIGPAMAVALLTTFYGAFLAYAVLNPLASKLERNSQEELLVDQLYVKGVGAIGRKENPRRLEMLLNTILPPTKRLRHFD